MHFDVEYVGLRRCEGNAVERHHSKAIYTNAQSVKGGSNGEKWELIKDDREMIVMG